MSIPDLSGVLIVNFEHISHLDVVFSIVNFKHVIAGWVGCTKKKSIIDP